MTPETAARIRTALVFLMIWIAAAGLSTRLHPNRYREGRSRDPVATVKQNQSSLARILGEFRTGLSDMLFIKTERYLHNGVAYMPHLTEELLTVKATGEEVEHHVEEMGHGHHDHDHHDHDHDHDHFHHDEDVETLLPTAEKDYRGWIGRMQREVKPWVDPSEPHVHTDGRELIPWFRMMTLSDPHYIRGYVLGAFWVERVDPAAALDFIEEGLEKNPDAFQLHLSKGYLLMREARELHPERGLDDALPDQMDLLLQAKDAFHRAAELGVRARPPVPAQGDIADHPDWSRYEELDARAAVNLSLVFEERHGDPARMETLRNDYRTYMPDHPRFR